MSRVDVLTVLFPSWWLCAKPTSVYLLLWVFLLFLRVMLLSLSLLFMWLICCFCLLLAVHWPCSSSYRGNLLTGKRRLRCRVRRFCAPGSGCTLYIGPSSILSTTRWIIFSQYAQSLPSPPLDSGSCSSTSKWGALPYRERMVNSLFPHILYSCTCGVHGLSIQFIEESAAFVEASCSDTQQNSPAGDRG